jgi:serine/threonine protein kinase
LLFFPFVYSLVCFFAGSWHGRYNSKADVWSLGVTLYQVCALDLPFKRASVFMIGMVCFPSVCSTQ